MRKILSLLLALLFMVFIFNGYTETIVFEGMPLVRNSASVENSINERVKGEKQINYKLIITKEGKNYIWFSREKKKLKYSKRGALHYFINPEGRGYIKISKARGGKYLYLEHMSRGLQTITYWGTADKLKP